MVKMIRNILLTYFFNNLKRTENKLAFHIWKHIRHKKFGDMLIVGSQIQQEYEQIRREKLQVNKGKISMAQKEISIRTKTEHRTRMKIQRVMAKNRTLHVKIKPKKKRTPQADNKKGY
jgi:hypothetical protein